MIIPSSEFWPTEDEIRRGGLGETMAMLGSREGQSFLFTVPFDRHDAGRTESKRPRQSNDCTVRALATASGQPYDLAYDTLKAAGRKAARGFDFRTWAKTAEFGGYRFEWMSFPAVKGMWRVNPVLFALKYPKGRFVLRTAGHVLACVDGRLSDVNTYAEASCVYGAHRLIHV